MARRERDAAEDRTEARREGRAQSGYVPVTSSEQPKPSSVKKPGSSLTSAPEHWPFGLRLWDDMSRFFGRLGMGREALWSDQRWLPNVDVLRRGDELVVRADLPGLKKDDISVDVANNVLTIRGERKEESKEEREGYYWHERSEGSFYRSIPLPEGANVEQARARFEDGVLEVALPAPKEREGGRHIEVR
jgi:HSP20 family protein